MFDLESGIREWRQALLDREALRAQDVDELEDHLREEYARLRAASAPRPELFSAEESFLIATRRLGRADALTAEFAKDDPGAAWRRRWIWMFGGYLAVGFAVSGIRTGALVAGNSFSTVDPEWRTVLYWAALALGLAGLAGLARGLRNRPWKHLLRRPFARRLLTTPGIVVLTVLAIAAKAAIVPITGLVLVGSPDGSYRFLHKTSVASADAVLWLLPFVVLAVLVWRDRERLRNASAAAFDEAPS